MTAELKADASPYWEVASAVADLVDEVLDEKALSMLKKWNRHCYVDASHFRDDLANWPYVGDPLAASQTDVMFYAFKEEEGADFLQDELRRQIHRASSDAIETWELPMRTLIEQACSFGSNYLPSLESNPKVLQSNAARTLSAKILDLLKLSDRDILLED